MDRRTAARRASATRLDALAPRSVPAALNVVVLGMHRSGTSAMAQVLRRAGLAGGDAGELLASGPENPAGFVERSAIVERNDALLASLGWTWDAPAPAPPAVLPPRDAWVRESRRAVTRVATAAGPWFIKDPRISVLLPWWRQVLLDRFVGIVMVRPPAEVAWSLWVRDGLPVALGHALWAAHHRHLAASLTGLPVIVVDYPALTQDPSAVVGAVLAGLRRLSVEVPSTTTDPADAIDPVLRRATQAAGLGFPDAGLAAAQQAWSMGPVAVFERFQLAAPAASDWEVAVLELQRRLRSVEAQEAAARKDRDRVAASLAQVEAQRDALEGDLAASRAAATVPPATSPAPAVDAPSMAPVPTGRPDRDGSTSKVMGRSLGRGRHALARARIRLGWRNPLWDAYWYRATYPDVRGPDARAWLHWRRHGWREGRDPNPLFDTDWYLATYPDVREGRIDPLAHYLVHGWHEGRDPGPRFDSAAYLGLHPDVRAARVEPLLHYLRYGAREGRAVRPRRDRVSS